jgi:hypothetical protein
VAEIALRSRPAAVAVDPAFGIGAAAALLLLAVGLFDPRLLGDGDTCWHLATGGWILDHGRVPTTDPFSFTFAGAPWTAQEWLSETLMALAFRADGWSGLVILYGIALGATALLLTRRLSRSLSGLSLVLTLTLALAPAAPNLLARPQSLALLITAVWTTWLLQARDRDRAPPLWAAGLMILWANMHGSFVLGFLLLGAFALEAVCAAPKDRRRNVFGAWAGFALACVAAAALTPQGPAGLIFPFKLMGMKTSAGIDEWRPMDFTEPGPFELALAAALFVCLGRGVKVPAIRLLLLLGLLHMALVHNRYAMITSLIAAMVLAPPLAAALGQEGRDDPRRGGERKAAWTVFAGIAVALIAVRVAVPLVRTSGPTFPAAAVDHAPSALRRQPVLNDYGLGGYLIFRGVRPYIDGRADLYGDPFVASYYRLMSPDPAALDSVLRDRRIDWTILSPKSPVVPLMDAKPGWRRLYADPYAVVHVRSSAFLDETAPSPGK